jgi:hypothetical protein
LSAGTLLLALFSAALVCTVIALSQRDRVTMSNIARLKTGARESEVRKILKGEARQIPCADESRWQGADPGWFAEEWKGRSIELRLLFDSDGRLRDWTASATGRFELTDRISNWIDWLGF